MKVKLKLFSEWAIVIDPRRPYTVRENENREIVYASSADTGCHPCQMFDDAIRTDRAVEELPWEYMAQAHMPR